MKSNVATWTLAASLLGGGVYLFFSYFASTARAPSNAGTLLGLLPFALALIGVAWNSRARVPALGACAAAALAAALGFDSLREHARWLYFLQHVGAMAALALSFGATLHGDPAQALCTRMAAVLHREPLDAAQRRYTWRLTAVWVGFFVACGLVSALLFALASATAWSLYADLGTPLLLGAMFVGEYLLRPLLLPGRERVGIGRILRGYVADAQARKGR